MENGEDLGCCRGPGWVPACTRSFVVDNNLTGCLVDVEMGTVCDGGSGFFFEERERETRGDETGEPSESKEAMDLSGVEAAGANVL